MEVVVKNIAGEDTGRKIELNDSIFGIEPNDHAIYLDVKGHLANKRQGTHKSKERADIVGSTKKLKRQKGTGTARAGSIKSPIFRGGGRVFGPRPKSYNEKVNKKVKALARKSALSYKAKDGQVIVIENFSMEQPKTKEFTNILNNLKINDKKSLFVLADTNKNIYLSARNLPHAQVVAENGLMTYNILNNNTIVLTEDVVKRLEKVFEK
ncbi:50S ribosomal protein L4 [Salinivirga cyanobacteriivorans]|uniref:Large ribosomal subunit protein uL4 n=1 Tax=Salinivirga cyanobacteriivorans TaxID=1307839 RepID=A0A0S2I350_9BACT|nr:50S ribosomal protein L4 [Salinivirga cyanobacteriivorans]ALO16663.1 50S ribosomal protein L4 [Salinivirga cyanobacteriivorans]